MRKPFPGRLHFNRYFSEDGIYGETSYRRLAQRWSTAGAFWSSRGSIVALNNMSATCPEKRGRIPGSERKLPFTGL